MAIISLVMSPEKHLVEIGAIMNKKTMGIAIAILVLVPALSFAEMTPDTKQDYLIEDVAGMILNKKFISTKYNISLIYPSSWDVVPTVIEQHSVVKIRSEQGSGLENVNISVIPLDDKREYSIKDFESNEVPELMTLLDSGRMQIGSEEALWKKMFIESSRIKSNKQLKEMLSAPAFMYRESEKYAISYQVQLVRNNHLYTITFSALDSTKELASKRFDDYKDLFDEMAQSFRFEKGQYKSSQYGLIMSIPDGWSKFSPRPGVLVSYGKLGSGENFMLRVNRVPSGTSVEKLTWEELFYPQFSSLQIEEQSSIAVNSKIIKYCIYKIADRHLK
ncbi:MAG: hypothetical protein ACRENZ_05225, partial [Thermodesulfobacteriota bacterium]